MPGWTALSEGLIGADLGVDRIVSHVLMKKPKRFSAYPAATRASERASGDFGRADEQVGRAAGAAPGRRDARLAQVDPRPLDPVPGLADLAGGVPAQDQFGGPAAAAAADRITVRLPGSGKND